MKMNDLRPGLANLMPEMIALRHKIHQNPELAFEEHATAELVATQLQAYGYTVHRGLGGTGVVGQMKVGSGSKSVGFRADMDALPILEASGKPYASQVAGKMHACGHDGHTATLLAAARHLAVTQTFNGTLNLIFQPAEEGAGGAKRMVEDGLFDQFPCDAIFALHNAPGQPLGSLSMRAGAAMASSDRVVINLVGKGTHAAMPQAGTDPIVCGAGIVTALQSIVARNVAPLDTAVITVGIFQAGTACNVVPGTARMELSVRSLNREVRLLLQKRITELVTLHAEGMGCKAEIDYQFGYPVLVNTERETAFCAGVAKELIGDARVTFPCPPVTGSEDFAFMLEHRPGCYFFLGNGDGEGSCMVHNPGYDFNDGAMETGAAMWCLLAERFLVA